MTHGNSKIFILMSIFSKNDVSLKCLVPRTIFAPYFRLTSDEACFNLTVVEGIRFSAFFYFVDNFL